MMDPPTGTVTMLFTDIEGSTRLAHDLGSRWPDTLRAHHAMLRMAIESHRGYVAGVEGDAFFACFETAAEAVAAAVDAQRELGRAAWPGGVANVQVRMGLHTGSVEHRDLGYVGVEVHRAARVGAAANGGQVLLTQATRSLVDDASVTLEYLGEHRLKDFPRPEEIFHLVIEGRRAAEFAPLRTAVARPTNLREDLRPLLGRSAELARLGDLLRGDRRLVTVVGPGGAGKTRLALAAARMMLDELPGGVFLAPLASVRDSDAMLDAVTRALDLRSLEGDPAEHIAARLRDRPTLLVLDNFEQLLHAGPVLGELVSEAPDARVLVTSQAPLRVAGERVMGLDALALDDAAELFLQRAQALAWDWSPSMDDRESILEICRRVGCLPLAVELAAARASVLAPAELLSRLEKSSDILHGGARDAPDRQQSLRATFEWTYGLLEPVQRTLFRRLGVFAGPVSLDTIEAVCEEVDDQPVVALDALEGLLDFSLVAREQSTKHGRRFTMPQALRDFACAELVACGDALAVQRRHAEHLAAVAERARIWFAASPARVAGVLALEAELRPALAWAAEHDSELYRWLVSGLALGLIRRGQVREALGHTTRAWPGDRALRDDVDAWLGNCRAYALLFSGRLDEAESVLSPVIAFYRERSDARGLGLALHTAGWVAGERGHDDSERALMLARESLDLLRSTGDAALADRGMGLLIQALISVNAIAEAEELLTAAAGSIADQESDFANAVATMRGDTALARGDASGALAHFAESLQLAARRGDRIQVVNDAHCVAHALALLGRPHAALEAAGAAAALGADSGYVNPFPAVDEAIAAARVSVEPSADGLVARGRNLRAGERVARLLALAET